MREFLTRFYKWFRSPRRFLKFLIAFIGASVVFHRSVGYDPDWGVTNLSLSIEASVASAGIILILEEIMDRLFVFLHEWRDHQVRDERAQAEVLNALVAMGEAQTALLSDHASILREMQAKDRATAGVLRRALDIIEGGPGLDPLDLDAEPAPDLFPELLRGAK